MIAAFAMLCLAAASMSAAEAPAALVRGPGLAPTAIAEPFVPNTGVDVLDLAPGDVEHQTVLRIDTDIRTDGYDIVIDGWVDEQELAEVRIWWLNPAKADQRSPFGSGVTRYVTIGYERLDDDGWRVRMEARKRQFDFAIRLEKGTAVAYASVDTPDGHVQNCRVTDSRLVAKKFLGLPIGLDTITVTCVDPDGKVRAGSLRAGKVP